MSLNVKRLLSAISFAVFLFIAVNASAQDADKSLALLKEGNARFVEMKMQYPDINTERRSDTAVNGQKPFAIILTCSDSRVPVESIFDRGIGDIFVVRVAGNIAIDPSVIGSIEYAAEHLNSPLLVVMGHTECGAVKAAISGPQQGGDVRVIQKTIEPVVARVKKSSPFLSGYSLAHAVVRENVLQAVEDILYKSKEIRHMVKEGRLKIVPAVYDLKSGVVYWL